ncbi:hypothetical protein J2X36_002156 [Methylobacterium sp. BE186]|uniref:hypothetical protein n=1 Tax=Methylobacterium sp. BE186 TaxID=2817715 RepID=UPI00285B8B0B|nr:hypothetical protein [Methylobacterium sp. BE186]MDR7037409.1 hypothetical protein [Methylobacterium sp. BE186]
MTALWGAVAFMTASLFLVTTGGYLSERGETVGEQGAGLFVLLIGIVFFVGGILLALIALLRDYTWH